MSTGDSGGAVFIRDDSTWKLAGINYGVDGPYNTNHTGSGFPAAIFDEGGMHKGGANNWNSLPEKAFFQFHLDFSRSVLRKLWTRLIEMNTPVVQRMPILRRSGVRIPQTTPRTGQGTAAPARGLWQCSKGITDSLIAAGRRAIQHQTNLVRAGDLNVDDPG